MFCFFFLLYFNATLSLLHRLRDKVGRVVSCTCTAGFFLFLASYAPAARDHRRFSPGAAPPQTRKCSENKGVSRTQVQLQLRREASVKHVCVQPTSVASSNMAGRDVFISQSVFASQTGHSAHLCYCFICLMGSLIHRVSKTRRRLITGFQVHHRTIPGSKPQILSIIRQEGAGVPQVGWSKH